MIEPQYLGGTLDTVERIIGEEKVLEISEKGLMEALSEGRELQLELSGVPVSERLHAIDLLGELWQERLMAGELAMAKEALRLGTGYPAKLIDLEFSLVPKVLCAEEIGRNLSSTLVGGTGALEGFVGIAEGEALRHMPAGPSMIISSGNSIIPTLIPTAISLATANFTLLKPSLSNYGAVTEVFAGLREIMSKSPAAHLMARCLCISYLGHDSPTLKAALTTAPFGVVNYWGGEPGRSAVAAQMAQNPHHPRLFVNGPLTGVAVVGEGADDQSVAQGLALNMVLYEQQLCSSPTMGFFVGGWPAAMRFASLVRDHLESIGPQFQVQPSNDALFVTNSARRVMALKGSKVLASRTPDNPWTLAVTQGGSNLEAVVASFPSFSVHGRRRFLELVVVPDLATVARMVAAIPDMKAYAGIDKVQTVGLSVPEAMRTEAQYALATTGAYRIVPVHDMFMRSAAEPYDGTPLASLFTYAVYERRSPMRLEGGF